MAAPLPPAPLVSDAPTGRHLARPGLLLLAVLLVAGTVLAGVPGARAESPPAGLGGFDPGHLISDATMFDGDRMSATQIDAFLAEHGAGCRTGGDGARCLKDVRMDTPQRAATAYCAGVPARTSATAGRIIADVAMACDVNPQVTLVMLQKEQGLITTQRPTQQMLDQALGFRCPDFQGCDPSFGGFVHQIYHASSRLQEYGERPAAFTYRTGRSYDIQYSPYAFCGYGRVTIQNRATAALYNYTPFTPTQATLDAGSAAVSNDVCATYGNRNFFRNFSLWFGTPNGGSTSAHPVAAPRGKDPAAPFDDVPYGSNIFFTEIAWMKHEKLSQGWPDNTYRPLRPIARDAMVAFLYRAAGEPAFTPPASSPFRDVPTGSQFYKEISWARSEGITTGWPDGTFRPLDTVNRDAMAAFLYRAEGEPAFTPPARSPFTDVSTRDSIFYPEITWLHHQRISTGWDDGTYRPLSSINRDAMAAFIYRLEVD